MMQLIARELDDWVSRNVQLLETESELQPETPPAALLEDVVRLARYIHANNSEGQNTRDWSTTVEQTLRCVAAAMKHRCRSESAETLSVWCDWLDNEVLLQQRHLGLEMPLRLHLEGTLYHLKKRLRTRRRLDRVWKAVKWGAPIGSLLCYLAVTK